jgi:serine/threonine-protein phosphatase 4 regulatory subunit 1
MRILAASLHELAKILHAPQIEADLLPVYKNCLTCNDEIRERVYEHVDVIISRVRPEIGWDLFEDLARAWKDGSLGGWRAREQLALHLPKMLELFRDVKKGERVLDVLRDALLDPFAAVRDGVTKGVSLVGDSGKPRLTNRFLMLMRYLATTRLSLYASAICCSTSVVPLSSAAA